VADRWGLDAPILEGSMTLIQRAPYNIRLHIEGRGQENERTLGSKIGGREGKGLAREWGFGQCLASVGKPQNLRGREGTNQCGAKVGYRTEGELGH